MSDTTETSTAEISSRYAREEITAHWRCPAPDGDGGRCFRILPCHVHHIANEVVGILAYGSSFLVPDSVKQSPTLAPIPEGWRSVGFVSDDECPPVPFGGSRPIVSEVDEVEAFIDEQLSRWFGVTTVVDPAMDREPGWALRGIEDPRPQPWETAPAYPHPETGRLAKVAPWLTIHPDGKATY